MSDINRYVPVIPPSGVVETITGNFFLFIAASAAVSIRIENGGHAEQLNAVAGGILVRRVKPWENLRILGAPGTTLEYYQGSSFTDKDETDVRLQIATIAGVAAFTLVPSATVAAIPPVVGVGPSAIGLLFPPNLLRKKLRIFTHPDNASFIFARTQGGGPQVIALLQPGSVYGFDGTYGLDYLTDSAAGTYTFYTCEEA